MRKWELTTALSWQEELNCLQPGRDAVRQWRSQRARSTTQCSPLTDTSESRSRSHRRYSLQRSRSMTRSLPQAVNKPPMSNQGARPKTTPKHVRFPNPPWTLVTESCQLGQEHTTDQPEDHGMAAMATLRFPDDDWDEELTLPTGSSDHEQFIDMRGTADAGCQR